MQPTKIFVAGMMIALVLGMAVIIFEFFRTFYLQYPAHNFCSTEDEVYQTMVVNLDEWINTMRQRIAANDIGWGSVTFSVPSGRTYVVSSYNSNTYRSYLLVVLKHSWNERLGFLGYIYSTLGEPSLEEKYKVNYLENDIYCYERKPGYD